MTFKERNLRKRGSETEDHIEARLRHAKEDMETAREVDFDLVIVNQVVEEAFEQFRTFVQPVSVFMSPLWPALFVGIILMMSFRVKQNFFFPF